MRHALLAGLILFAAPAAALADDQAPAPSAAEVRADRLDSLFARLHVSTDPQSAQKIESDIWAIWSSSDSPTAEVLLRQASRAMGDGAPEQALDILNTLIGAYPDFAEAWNRRATLYFEMKRDDLALKDISKVLELEPRHFGALAGRGLIYQREKNYSAALDAFNEALDINPGMDAIKDAVKAIMKQERAI